MTLSLNTALSIASGGLRVVSNDLGLVSQNITNANTPDYAVETSTRTSVTAGGLSLGVRSGPAARQIDLVLQAATFGQNATVADLSTRQRALQAIDAAQGAPGQGNDLGSLLGNLQNAFSTLQGQPDNRTQQTAVVSAANDLAQGLNTLSTVYATQRQAAHDDIVSSVDTLNISLATIGQLTSQIITQKAAGASTADLENQRDTAVRTVSQLVNVKVLNQASGDLILTTSGGLLLPTRESAPFAISGASLGAGAWYPGGGIPPLTLNGVDVTGQVTGGQIGADIALRDTTLPTYQGELDEFAASLATRFDAQGLRLFTAPNGTVPATGGTPAQSAYVGFAGTIQVTPQVRATTALVRDGTSTVAGSPTGASAFTPNPTGGPASFGTLIARVLDFAFGTEAQLGVPQPAPNTTGLGPSGSLNAPYAAPASLAAQATTLVASQAQESARVSSHLTTEQAMQTSLNSRMQAISGVNMDAELAAMIQLQNAYSANARIITSAQKLFEQTIGMVQ